MIVCLGLLATCASAPVSGGAPGNPPMVDIPAGRLWMGSDSGPQSSCPPRQVYLDGFEIDLTEVTVAAVRDYLEQSGVTLAVGDRFGSPDRADWPAVGLVWREAQAYCTWRGARLPTEAEWEKAARGTDGRAFPWGEGWDATRTNSSRGGPGHPISVGTFPEGRSPFGVLDMAGNVAEWVADTYDPAYYKWAPASNPTGPNLVLGHSLRGGSWASDRRLALTYFRD